MPSSTTSATYFSLDEVYPCPVCRLGQLKALSMMDAMACNSCRHIFTASLDLQRLLMADRQPTLIWYWNGQTWLGAHTLDMKLGWGYLLIAVAFVILPPALIALSAYFLLQTPGTSNSWLPPIWAGLAFLCHLAMIGCAVVGFYQFSIATYLKVMQRNLFCR